VLSTTTLAFILLLFMLAPIQAKSNFVDVTGTEPEETTPIETVIPVKSDSNVKTIKADTLKKVVAEIKDEPLQKKSGYTSYFSKIDNGKKVLCFFAPGCDHCQGVAKELTEMKAKVNNFPEIKIIFMNEEADLIPAFFKIAGAEYPFKIIEIIPFYTVLGTGINPPGMKYLWNGNEMKFYHGTTDNKFNAAEFKTMVHKSYSALKSK